MQNRNWWEDDPVVQAGPGQRPGPRPAGQRRPLVIEGPPREPPPVTPNQDALDAANVAQSRAAAAKSAAETQRILAQPDPADINPSDPKNRGRIANLNSVVNQINRVQELYDKGIAPTSGIAGLLDLLPTERNRQFDTAGAGLSEQGLASFRVPGVGSQSDAELRQFVKANTPTASDYDLSIEEKLRQLRQRVDESRRAFGLPAANWTHWRPRTEQDGQGQGGVAGGGSQQPPPEADEMNRRNREAWETVTSAYRGKASEEQLAGIFRKYGVEPPAWLHGAVVDRDKGRPREIMPAPVIGGPPSSPGGGAPPSGPPSGPDGPATPFMDYMRGELGVKPDYSSRNTFGGAVDAFGRGAADTLTFGMADEISAAANSILPLNEGSASVWDGSGLNDAYRRNLATQRNLDTADEEVNPYARLGGQVTGLVAGPAALARQAPQLAARFMSGGKLARAGKAALADTAYGGAYGAGSATEGHRAAGAAQGAAYGLVGGQIGRGVAKGGGRLLTGARDAGTRYLASKGVPMTIGQIAGRGGVVGRTVKGIEDKLMSVPFLGDAIRQRRDEGVTAFNSAAFREALEPIGETTAGQIAEQGVDSARGSVSNAYSRALSGVQVAADDIFVRDMKRSMAAGAKLHPEIAEDFQRIVQDQIAPELANGALTGDGYQALRQVLRQERSAWKGQPRGHQYGQALRQVEGALESLVRRQAPEVAEGLNRADRAYGRTKVVESAVERGKNTGGVFTPAQLGISASQSARKYGGNAATTQRPFFDLQRAGQDILPSQVPDSGTAGRAMGAMLPAALGGAAYGTGMVDENTALIMASMGIPYTKAGRATFQTLMVRRPDLVRRAGEQLLSRSGSAGLLAAPIALPALQGQ